MKKIFFTFLLAINPLWVMAAQVCETLTVTGPPVSPPASWIEDGKLTGASVRYVEIIAQQAGVKKIVFKAYANWADALNAARLGEVDVIFSAAQSVTRARYLNFISPPYASQFLYAIVRKGDKFSLLRYHDLINRKGAAGEQESFGQSTFGLFVESELTLERAPNVGTLFDWLLSKKVDYILAYENAAYNEIFTRHLTDKVDIISTFPFHTDTYIAFSKRSDCFIGLEQAFSTAITNDRIKKHTYFHLMNKYRDLFNSNH